MGKKKDDKIPPPLCVFCSAPWTDSMMQIEASASEGCETCGFGGGPYGTVTVTCSSCKKVVYIKEFDHR